MTTKTSSVTTSPVRALRSSLRLFVPLGIVASVLVAAPALADVPEGWPTPEDGGSFMDHLLLVVIIPLAAAAVLGFLAYLPALLGKDKDKTVAADGEWMGGPRGDKSGAAASRDAGGASGSW